MNFERFYLIDLRGENNRIVLKFVHIDNSKEIKCNTSRIIEILQKGEIQVQTRFSTKKFIEKYSKHKYRNLRSMQEGDPINIYYIPVEKSEDNTHYIIKFYETPKSF